MYSTIPIHWDIKSAPASSGRSRVGPALYVFSLLGHTCPHGHHPLTPPPPTRLDLYSSFPTAGLPPIQTVSGIVLPVAAAPRQRHHCLRYSPSLSRCRGSSWASGDVSSIIRGAGQGGRLPPLGPGQGAVGVLGQVNLIPSSPDRVVVGVVIDTGAVYNWTGR